VADEVGNLGEALTMRNAISEVGQHHFRPWEIVVEVRCVTHGESMATRRSGSPGI
jgi:hypothetical protein